MVKGLADVLSSVRTHLIFQSLNTLKLKVIAEVLMVHQFQAPLRLIKMLVLTIANSSAMTIATAKRLNTSHGKNHAT
jgi:hypothetical protein